MAQRESESLNVWGISDEVMEELPSSNTFNRYCSCSFSCLSNFQQIFAKSPGKRTDNIWKIAFLSLSASFLSLSNYDNNFQRSFFPFLVVSQQGRKFIQKLKVERTRTFIAILKFHRDKNSQNLFRYMKRKLVIRGQRGELGRIIAAFLLANSP